MKEPMKKLVAVAVAAAFAAAAVAAPQKQAKAKKPAQAFNLADVEAVVFGDMKESAYERGRTAAADITNIIYNITGKQVPCSNQEHAPKGKPLAIWLGDTKAARDAGVTTEGLRNGDWRVKADKSGLYIVAKSGGAVMTGLFDFADRHLGYHVLFPDDGPDAFTPDPKAVVPVCDYTVRPAIYQREIYHARFNGRRFPVTKKYWERYGRALGVIGAGATIEGDYRVSQQTRHCHSTFDYLPPEKHFAEHPEWYSMGPDGKRRGMRNSQSQLCYSNPEVYERVKEAMLGFIAKDREKGDKDPPLVYDFTQQDNSGFLCLCPECKKIIAKYNRVEGGHREGGDAGLQLEFVNRLARDVRAKYPDVQIRTFAYVSTEQSPKPGTIKVEPNVRIWWCDVYSTRDATVPLRAKGHFNEKQATELKEWMELTRNIEIWDYLYYGNSPGVLADSIKSDVDLFARGKVKGIYMEDEYSGCGSLWELNAYLLAKLYIDPKRDVDELIRTFCLAYGAAADDMYDAFQYLRGEMAKGRSRTLQESNARLAPWMTNPDVMATFARKVEKAYAKEKGEKYRARMVPILFASVKHLISLYRKDPGAGAKVEKLKALYRKYGVERARIAFMEPSWRGWMEKGVEDDLDLLTLRFKDLPDELKDVPENELLSVDWHWRGDGKKVDDPKSERGKASCVRHKPDGIAVGAFDRQSKKSYGQRQINATKELCAEKYTWIKMKTLYVGMETIVWFPGSWSNDYNLRDFHIMDDGMEVSPNWYDLWMSARYEDGTLYVDRLALRRVAPPKS